MGGYALPGGGGELPKGYVKQEGSGFREFRVQGSGFRIQGSGFRV